MRKFKLDFLFVMICAGACTFLVLVFFLNWYTKGALS